MLGDECFVGEHAVLASGREGVPVQDRRAGRGRSTARSCGRAAARARCSAGSGVAGLANVDITPELATRVAMAYATTLKKGSTIVTSRDSSRSARMLKRAMMAGANAAGANVLDLEVASVPGHPVHRPAARARRRPHHPADGGGPAELRDPVLRHQRRRPLRGRPAQGRAALRSGGLPAGVPRRDRRHRLPAPGPRAVHRRPRGHRRHRGDPGGPVQGRRRLRLRLHLVRDAERPGQARGRHPRREPLRLHRWAPSASTAPPTASRWPATSGPPGPTSGP